MTVDEIYSNIRYNENLIDQYNAEKNRLNRQINELEALRSKFSSLQNRFEDRQSQRRERLQQFRNSAISNQIVRKYCDGMGDLLDGSGFYQACEGLEDAKRRIYRKIMEIDNQIDECESRIRYRHDRRGYWINELHKALAAQEG